MNAIESIEVINGREVKVTTYLGSPDIHASSPMQRKAEELRKKKNKKKSTKGKNYNARDGLKTNPDDFCNWNDTALYC
jgi:hypothetical protein